MRGLTVAAVVLFAAFCCGGAGTVARLDDTTPPVGSPGPATTGPGSPTPPPADTRGDDDGYTHYTDCAAARAAGAAPLYAGEPGYRTRLDRDSDGTACE